MSADIFKQKLFDEKEMVQYLQNYKCYDVNQGHFRKSLQSSGNTTKIYLLKLPIELPRVVQLLTNLIVWCSSRVHFRSNFIYLFFFCLICFIFTTIWTMRAMLMIPLLVFADRIMLKLLNF